ncbi:MAG: hypothetical protein PHR90_11235, partial [Sphaerochaetaceae bacterium]|nr:hypothetical protein [Sphaerochaetaceae bacterium]
MSYFVPITDALRDAFLDDNSLKYLQVVIDPSGTPVTFVPMDISCDASEDYQKWSFSLKNREGLSVGLYANDAAIVQVSHNGSTWVTVTTGYVSDDGIRRTRGMVHDDYVYIDLHDATKRKGTKRKPEPALLVNFKIVDTANTAVSVLHYLASLMGASVETVAITKTHELIEVGNDTVWAELQRLKEAYHADMYFRYDGKLLFRSPLENSYAAPSSEWTFQADPDNAVSGNACRVYNKLQEIFMPVSCNYAKTTFPDYEQLALGVIYKHTENYDEASDVISVEVAAGAYWPGPNATDVAKLQYASPDNGEDYPFAVDVVTPTIGATGGGTDIEYTGGTLSLVSFNGSTSATSHEAGAAQIILQNTGAATCTIRKLTVRGKAYRKIDDEVVTHMDDAVASAVDYVEKEVDGKYMVSASQAFDTLYHMVEEGKGRPRRFAFDAPFMPWLQRRAIVNVQPPGEEAVRCVVNTYNHRNRSNRTLQGMRTSIVCTELGTYTPSGEPSLVVIPTNQPLQQTTPPPPSLTIAASSSTINYSGRGTLQTATIIFTIYAHNITASDISCTASNGTLTKTDDTHYSLNCSTVSTSSVTVTASVTVDTIVYNAATTVTKVFLEATPIYLGMLSAAPSTTSAGEPIVIGDYFLYYRSTGAIAPYVNGTPYRYNGSSWAAPSTSTSDYSTIMGSVLTDALSLNPTVPIVSAFNGYFQQFAAANAFITNLTAQKLSVIDGAYSLKVNKTDGLKIVKNGVILLEAPPSGGLNIKGTIIAGSSVPYSTVTSGPPAD